MGMRFQLTRSRESPLGQQITTQVILAIASGELRVGERLPSTRDLARRYGINLNTVSSAYQRLREEGWIEMQRGRGVYVGSGPAGGKRSAPRQSVAADFDLKCRELLAWARQSHISQQAVKARLALLLQRRQPRVILLEDRAEVRDIVSFELRQRVRLSVAAGGIVPGEATKLNRDDVFAVMPRRLEAMRRELPVSANIVLLRIGKIDTSLLRYLPIAGEMLIGIASGWGDFIAKARTMLLASGLDARQLVVRDARKPNWKKGLDLAAAVVCDSLTASKLPSSIKTIVHPLVSEASLEELESYERFYTAD